MKLRLFLILVHVFDFVLIFFKDNSSLEFERGCQFPRLNAEGFIQNFVVFNLLITRQRFIDFIDLLLNQSLDFFILNQFFIRALRNVVVLGVTVKFGKIGNN